MPSSTSSSEVAIATGFVPVRQTAADRPGIAQPVPVRDIPAQPWRAILIGAAVTCALLIAGWEMYWRAYGATPSYRNSDGQWLAQRRRPDNRERAAAPLGGASPPPLHTPPP